MALRPRRPLVLLALLVTLCSWRPAVAQDQELSPEELREQRTIERFQSLLEQRPRYGVALDRLYGYHVERGTIEELTQTYRDRTADDETDGTSWMVLGMLQSHRGNDAEAVQAFRKAEEYLPEEPLASYYLAQSLVLIGRPDEAVEAFERAIARDPVDNDLLEIFQELGRVHQRAHHNEAALAVWDRLEARFPNDLQVQEQIAAILAEEGNREGALQRYEALARKTQDRYEQVQYTLKAAELKLKLGRSREGIGDMEGLLAELRPDSWLYSDVREKIEGVFLRTDDYAGLADYYEHWLEKHPEDLDAMTRLGQALSLQGRVPEARTWFSRAIELAPSNASLRLALIEQLVAERSFTEAIKQYEQLDEYDPNNPDYVSEWGRLIMEDKSVPEEQRRERASQVWRKLLEDHADDPVLVTQVADMLRHAGMTDEAIELYQRAIELAPADPQYREYLGEFYHRLNRPDDARATWAPIAAGDNRNTRNLVRLAEVYDGFGYSAEAIETMRDACSLDPEFSDRLRFAELLRDADQTDQALQQLDIAEPLAETPDERQQVLAEQIKCYQQTGELVQRTDRLSTELAAGMDVTADRWQTLALYYEAERELGEATSAIREALALDEQSITVWTAAARIFESSGLLGDAADANEKLTQLDRRFRTEYLTEIARLRLRLGQGDAAIRAAEDLVDAAPGNPEHYQFYADVCFQLGREEDGLDALRRSVRVNPADDTALLALAGALGEQFRTDEAIELYWRAFDKSPDLEGQISIIGRLADLYLRTNHFDRLVTRLETMGREVDRERDTAICLANAYSSAGDLGMARETLERLLTEETRDTQLLTQLVRLSEQENDAESAVLYQRRLNEIAPSSEGTLRLANLLMQTGDIDEAELMWTRMVEDSDQPDRMLQAVDRLLQNEKYETVLNVTERMLRDDPRNWEAMYRRMVALWKSDQPEKAAEECRDLLALKLPHDERSAAVLRLQRQSLKTSGGSSRSSSPTSYYPEVLERVQATYEVRRALGLDPDAWRYSGTQTWSPGSFGQARIAALMVLQQATESGEPSEQLQEQFRAAAMADNADRSDLWDWYYLKSAQRYIGNTTAEMMRDQYTAARRLSEGLDPDGCIVYLQSLAYRTYEAAPNGGVNQATDPEPMSDDELEHMLACFEKARSVQGQWSYWSPLQLLQAVTNELKTAGREDEAQKMMDDIVGSATSPNDLSAAIGIAAQQGDVDRVLKLTERLEQASSSKSGAQRNYYGSTGDQLAQLIARRAAAEEFDDVLQIVDFFLDQLDEQLAARTPSQRYRSSSSSTGPVQVRIYTIRKSSNGQEYASANYMQLDYPAANAWFDDSAISLLRNAYEVYNRADLLSDLINHLEHRVAGNADEPSLLEHLALCYLYWWHDLKEDAASQMQTAVEAMPGELDLRLQLALIRHHLGDTDGALALVDEVEPLNHQMVEQREMLALQFAMLSGNVERARTAAERLFGLRIRTEVQLQLADYMHQLGMHELAEAMLARARRRAGGRTSSLLSLMQHYQTQGDKETAVEIAFQILRRARPRGGAVYGSRSGGDDDAARQQAVQVLSQSGQLDDLIARAKEQLERSPNSLALRQTLVDYYRASGQQDLMIEELKEVAKLRPDDARHQYSIAQQLIQAGQQAAACDFYLVALRKMPSILNNDFYEVQNAFQQADRMDDLLALFNEIDLRKVGQYYYITNLVENLVNNEKTRESGITLFKRLWEDFPNERSYILGNINQEEVWKLPEMYDYARQALIPETDQVAGFPWGGITDYNVMTRLMDAAQSQNKLDALREEVVAKREEIPTWSGGQALLAIIDARRAKLEESQQELTAMMDDLKEAIPMMARYQIAQQLMRYEPLNESLVRLYEEGMDDYEQENWGWGSGPANDLARLYVRVGRKPEAREILVKSWKESDFSRYYGSNQGYAEYAKINLGTQLAQQLVEAGFPVDALRICNDMTSNPQSFQQARQYGGDYLKQRYDQAHKKATEAITPETLVEALAFWLIPPKAEDASPDETTGADATGDDDQPAFDLMLSVQPPSMKEARVTSVFEKAIEAAATNAQTAKQVDAQLEQLTGGQETPLGLDVTAALLAFASENNPERQLSATQHLADVLGEHPLDPLEEGERPNARQRSEAREQLGVWLVARQALAHEQTHDLGRLLADRAVEAARRQTEDIWVLAILREQGESALEAGHPEQAEQHFKEMLDLILPPAKPAENQDGKEDRLSRKATSAPTGGEAAAPF